MTPELTALERGAITVALTRLFDPQRFFSICDFDNICRVAGVAPSRRVRDTLALLHCVSWSDMPTDTRREATRLILDTLGVAVEHREVQVVDAPASPTRTFFGRLLRGGA